jgi:hypothetical protein
MQSLDGISNASIQIIRSTLAEPLHVAVRRVELQIFVDADNYAIPGVWMYFVGENMKTSETSRELGLHLNKLEDIDELYFSNYDFGGLDLIADIVKAWVAECWWKAGGWDYKVPAVLDVHDGHGNGERIQLTATS